MIRIRFALIAIVLCSSLGCALKYKATAVNLAVGTETALGQFQDAVRAICNPTVPPLTPITDCTQASQASGMTAERFRAVSAELAKAFIFVRDKLEPALRAWKTGQPAPQEYADFYRIVDEAVRAIRPVLNAKWQSVVDAIAAVTEALGQLGDALYYGKTPEAIHES